MDTDQLQDLMERELGPLFLGVYPRDHVPPTPPKPAAMIINLDPASEPGSHWVAIFFDDEGHGEFFCSYGNPPELFPDLYHFLVTNSDISISWSSLCLQGPQSASCGQYCCFYLYHRAQDIPMHKILEKFTKDQVLNDCLVADWVNERFEMETKCHPWAGLQKCLNRGE